MFDKSISPHAIDIEEVVLGALMMNEEAYDAVSDFIDPEFFYNEYHKITFKAILDLKIKNHPVDMLTVLKKLEAKGELITVGGAYFISQLTARVGGGNNIEYHCRILQEKFIYRELLKIASQINIRAGEATEDIFDLVADLQLQLDKLITFQSNNYGPEVRTQAARETIVKAMSSDTGLSGVPTGYDSMDEFTGGWQPGDLIIMGGWPGTYKSALTLALLDNAEREGVPTLFFEGEMSETQTGIREIAKQTGIDIHSLKTGKITEKQWNEVEGAIGRIDKKKVFVDFEPGLKAHQIRSRVKKAIKEHGIGLVAIDYLRLYDIERKKWGTEEAAIDNFCRENKLMAKQLKIPVILLCHFTKQKGEGDSLKPPHMGLLKGSGGISANADIVILLWNPAASDENFMFDFRDGKGIVSCKGKIGLVYDKNRQGKLGMQWLNVSPGTHVFSDREFAVPEHVRTPNEPNIEW